jgi:hypothetical protein
VLWVIATYAVLFGLQSSSCCGVCPRSDRVAESRYRRRRSGVERLSMCATSCARR